jgi:hypothetical protein
LRRYFGERSGRPVTKFVVAETDRRE